MSKNGFYKNNYLIAVYDESEVLMTVCDNPKEFSLVYDKEHTVACKIIRRLASGIQRFFHYKNEKFTLVLIPLDENDIKEFDLEMKKKVSDEGLCIKTRENRILK